MKMRTMKRLVRIAMQQNPRMSQEEAEDLAGRVAESLAERSRPKGDPAWEGCC